jgi:hypothetical protein
MDDVSYFLTKLKQSISEELQKVTLLGDLRSQLERDVIYAEHIENQINRVQNELSATRDEMNLLADLFLRVPPCHSRHRTALKEFHNQGNYDSSVFIMTKFPEGNTENDQILQNIINLVSEGVRSHGFTPRVASGAKYHHWLWDEVEIHLLGSSKGIAIVEDKYRPELNPNVAMEWGWMRAMGKKVLFLQEEEFNHGRADFAGLRSYQFNWTNPKPGIQAALESWI